MNDNEEWGEIEPVETADDFGEVEPLRWEDGDGGEERLPEGERNQWGGNLRNEGRRVLLRRDKDGKVNGYSTTSSMLVRHDDGKFAVVPTVVGGRELSQEEAVKHYAETGEHWGMADDEESAQKMAQEVHDTHMKGNQAKWNDWLHEHWDEVSDDIRNDRGMAYEHKKRTAPDKITLMERLANDDTEDERKKRDEPHQKKYVQTGNGHGVIGYSFKFVPNERDEEQKRSDAMDDLAAIAKDAGLADWQVKRIRSESKTPEEMREALKYVAGNRPVRDGEEPEKETAGWRSVPKTIVNTAGKMAAGFINLVGTVAGGVDEDARHAFMADDPMAKKEGETFDAWLGRVNIDEKVKRMAKRDPAVRENLEKYFRWEAPVAGKEGMHQEHSIMVQNGREGTGVGNAAIRDAKRLRNWLDEKTPVGNSGSPVVDWLEGAASGIAQFAYLGPAMIAMSAADSYQQTHSTALESGKSGGAAEGLAAGSALFDGAMTAAFYYAPFRRWMNGKGIVPVQPVEKFTFGGLSKAMGRFNAKREFLNQGVAAIEAGGIMGVQGAGDTAFRQLASGQDLDLGEITIEGLKGVRDGVAIGAIMGAGRILNARIKGARDYEKVVRAAAQTPDGRLMLASLNPDGMMDLKRFIQEGIDVAKAHEKPAADFEADTRGNVAEGRAPAPDWKPTEATMRKFQELCDKAGLPPDAKLAIDVLFDPRVANYLGDTLNAKFRNAANAQPEHAAIPEKPIIDAETGKVVSPSQALAKRVNREFGVEPAHFDLPQTADGKPGLVPMKWRDNKTGKENTSNLAHDPKTGVTIMEEEDGTFSVHNDTGDSDGAATLGEAVEKARELALMGQYTVLDRERKRRVIENERAAKYGKRNVVYFNTMADAAQAFENGIARDGSFLGLTNANQLRNPVVQDRDAFYTPDGTAVVILDNVHEVGDIPRILAHEIVGHGGPNAEFGGRTGAQAVFAENIRAKEFDAFKKQVSDGLFPKLHGTPEEVNRNLGEVFAHYASVNLDKEPSKLDKLVNSVNKAARKIGLRKTYSAADVRTMMAKWRDAAKGEGGTALNLADGSPRFDFFAPDKPAEAPGERGEVQTGKETPKPTEAPTGDSGASGDVPRRQATVEEVVASSKTPFTDAEEATLESAADVSGIDETVEMPKNAAPLSFLSSEAPIVRLNPAKIDRSDAILPNMKKDANRKSGITKPLEGEWHPTMGGVGAVWLTKDGKLTVITGRHRSELAERKGKSMLYYLFREADGFTKENAMIYDAVANIHDEKGTINDYLGFLDKTKPTRDEAEKAGILYGKGLVAWSLYRDATDAVRNATATDGNPGEGQISPQQATVIAEAAPRDADKRNPSIQRQLLKTALGGMRGKAFDMYARIRADELSRTPLNENLLVGEQMDLFSSPEDQAADILAQRQSQYRTKKAQGYQTVAQNLRAALNKEGKLELTDEYAKDLGVTDKSDKKQLEAAYDKAVERANYWENTVRLDDADKAAMDAEINAAADAKAKKLAELKAKREAAKSGKPAPKPAEPVKKPEPPPAPEPSPKKTVSAPQKEWITAPPKPEKPAEGQKTGGANASNGSVTPKQADAFVGWRRQNPSAKIHSVFLRKDGTVSFGYEDGSGVARSAYIFADGERSNATPVHIAWNDFDEIHGKDAVRIDESDLGTQKAESGTLKADLETKTTKTGTPAPKAETPVVLENRTTEKPATPKSSVPTNAQSQVVADEPDPAMVERIFANTTFQGGNRAAKIKAIVDTWRQMRDMVRPGEKVDITEIYDKIGSRDAVNRALNYPDPFTGKRWDGRQEYEDNGFGGFKVTRPQEELQKSAPVRKNRTTEKSSQVAAPRQPSIKMKDEAAEKLAQKQEDDLAALFDTPELDAERDSKQLQEIYDIISANEPEAAAKRLKTILQEIKDGKRRIRPYRAEEIIRGTQGHNNALGVLALVARATGESFGRNAYGGKSSWTAPGDDVQEARQRNALTKVAKGLGIYIEPGKLGEIISDQEAYIDRGQYSTVFADRNSRNYVVKVRELGVIAEDSDIRVEGGAVADIDDLLLSNAILGEDFDTQLIGLSERNGHVYLVLRQPRADSIPIGRDVVPALRDYMVKKGFSPDEEARDYFANDDYIVNDLRLGANIGMRNGKLFPFDPISTFTTMRKESEQVLFDTPELSEKGAANVSKYLSWAKKWKLDPSKKKYQREWADRNGVSFDTPEFDPDVFQKRVGAVAKLVKTYKDSGVADFKTLATRMAERFPEKFDAMKPYLRGVWNAVADQMNLSDVSRGDAERVYGIIEAQTKEVEDGADTRGQHGVDAAEPATSGGEQQPGGVLADRPVREQNPDGRVDGQRSGDVPGLGDGVAKGEASERGEDAGGGTPERAGAVADSAEPKSGEREDGRDSGEDGHNANAHVKKRAKKAADSTKPNPKRRDFVMTKAVEEAILEKKTAQRVRNNLEAIKLIRELKAKDYAATPEEQATLAKFVGWGGLREDVFGYGLERAYDLERSGDVEAAKRHLRREGISQSAYDLHKELRSVLNDSEYESAKASASTAFYTPIYFVEALHDNLRHLGVKGGRFLGPSAGVGNFASASGEYEKPVNWQFVEKDAMTGEMLKALFPNQRVTIGGFEDTKFPDGFFDFAIDNVPYADVPINDRSLSSKMFKIHDYFFAKTLSKLRPGGVMAFLTSTGTLDKTSPILRQFLTEHGGKIVGAVRLPNGFFSENAGTDVASDLVIVQKVQGRPDNSAFEKGVEYGKTEEWVRRKGRIEKPLTYNGYFQDHPDQIVGKMEIASGQFGPTLKYTMPDVLPGDLSFEISKAIGRALGGIDKDALLKSAAVAEKQDHTPIYDEEGLRQGNVTMKDGKPFIKSGEMLEPITLPNDRALTKELAKRFKSPTKIMEGLLDLRKAMREVIDAQMADNDMVETDLAPLLAKLNEVYDAFVKKNGTLHDKWVSPFVLLDKADGNRLLALERVVKDENGKPKVVKSDIFTKRVISRGQRATKADTPKDALVISYSEMGAINVPRIAELLGVDHEEAIAKLKEGGDAFENPQTGLLEPSWEYLSGRVRAKLAAARAAVEAGEESYRANIEALEKVQPPMVRLEDAEIKFGATWVDPECMKDFLRDAFGAESMRINLGKNEVTGQWNVEFGRVMNEDPWGETSWSPQEFVSRVLNHGSMNHYDTDPVDKKRYLNERRTEGNKLAAEKLHHAFSQFIQSSDKWASPMYERYNAVMTDMVEIKLPNNVLPFRAAGMSEATLGKLFEGGDPKQPKKGREYQSDVIARGVLGGNSLCLAHCVGAGKTLEMQSIGVLGRHLGLFKKPMYVVPNHMLEQFTNEFVEAFPNANILKMSEADVKPENRRAFFAQVANGDWDAIVVKHSTFSKKLAMSDEYQKEFVKAQRRGLIEAIAAMREAGEKISVDQATKKLERLEAKLEQLANAENHDSQIVPFEELGVDQLFVDEAHNFKGMPITTRQGRTGGLSQGDSQRAVDMQMKTQYVQSLHGGDRGVVFATGTPLSNAPVVEAYVMLKYLAPNKLEEQGLKHFDDFVDAFGRITTESEFSLDGKTVKEKEKVSAFVNIPELMKLLRSVVDIVNPDQLDIPRPKPKYHMIDVDMTPAQETIMEMVAREAATPPSREERNKYLTLTRIAKNACLTPRLLGYEDGGNKIVRAVSEIKKVYDETADNRGAQLVFTDMFNESEATGSQTDAYMTSGLSNLADNALAAVSDDLVKRGGGAYNLNEEIRDLLVQAGVPKDEIAIIQDIDKSKGDKDANKSALFAKVRSGEVRILIGSRPKMGEGTNVQERLAAIHLLHPGWKPAEDEQAIGRIIRFGNTYKEGQIFYYLTKGNANIGSYETKNHQLIGVKSKLIDQVMHGDDTVREIDMDESAMDRDMLMGLASGNKALMELIDVKKRVHKLELNTESTLTSARRNKDKAEANSRILERRREEFAKEQEGVKEWREKNEGKPFTLSTPDGRSIEKVKEMADYVAAQVVKQLTKDRYDRDDKTVLGDFNGVELVLAYDKWGDEKFRLAIPLLGVAREINYSGFIPDFSQGAMTAFKGKIFETVSPDFAKAYENSLADMDRQAKKMSADADKLQKDYEQMRDELIQLRTRQAELERAVTPLVIQAVENRKAATYGNWIITKPGSGRLYVANRESDTKSVSAPTVKELIPLMNAEDFASPRNAATKTIDLRPHLKPNSKGEYPHVDTLSAGQVDFDTPDLSPAEEAYSEAEDKTPTEKVMREVYGMTNDEIGTALKAAGMEPPKHVRKPDETAWKQAEALLSNPSYMAKLSRAVAKFPRNIADYENNALNVLFRQRQAAVNAAQSVVDGLKETLDAFDAIPKEERDTDFNEEQRKTASDYAEAKSKLAQAKSLMYETGLALTRSSSEAGRRLRSNRGLIDQTDYSYAGISGEVAAILGGADKITPEMDARIREIAGEFASLDDAGRDLATVRLKAHAEKIVEQIKNADKVRRAVERKTGDEVKRVMRNYNDALAQIEVGAAEVGGTLVGLSDQQYPAWGKWLRAIGEYHCFANPDITEEECINAIVEDISPFITTDANGVRDALTGFGHNFRQSRYEAQRMMNDLRSQSRLKRQIDWMDEHNTMPPLTGLVRDEPSDTTRNLQKQVQERKKEVPDAGRDERRLKGVLESAKTRVKNRIADLERAIETGEKIPGRDRTVPEDIELRELKKRKDELQKAYDELFKTEHGLTDEQRVKLAERLLGRELEHALADLDRARSGDFSKRPKRPGVESPTIDALRDRLNEVRGQIRELKNAKYEFGMTPDELNAYNVRKMANREKAVARLAERIVRGDLRPQVKPQPPMPKEMQKRYDELAEQMSRAHRKLADLRREAADARKPKFVRFIGDAYRFVDGVWKMATASLDFTQVGNQTGSILMAHPKIVAENFAKTLSAFKSVANAENIELDILSDASVKEAVDNGWLRWKKVSDSTNRGERVELFDAIDKPFTIGGKAIRFTDIPFYGTAIANSDRLYATYINAASASLYSTIINDPKLFPGGATVFQKKMLCDMINVMNGSGTLSKGARRYAGKVFWAPGLVDSQLKRLLGYQIWHPWLASAEEDGSGTFKERATMSKIGLGEFVRSNLGALLLGGLLFALFATDDQKDEYAHAGFVKRLQMMVAPRIRHTQLDFTGGSVAFLRLGNRLATGAYETATGKQAKVRDTFSEVAHFAKGRLTPLVSNVFSAMSGKDYTGQDYGAGELLLSFAPISLREAGKSIYENGIEDRAWSTAFLGAALTMFGVGKGTYRKDDYAVLSNRFLESKKEYDAIDKDDLIDDANRKVMLDSIIAENPLMRDEVREDIAADIAQIRKDEARARKDEREGVEPDADLLSEIETGKAKLIEKIRAARRK